MKDSHCGQRALKSYRNPISRLSAFHITQLNLRQQKRKFSREQSEINI